MPSEKGIGVKLNFDYCKLGKYDFNEMELQIRVCNRIAKSSGSLSLSLSLIVLFGPSHVYVSK